MQALPTQVSDEQLKKAASLLMRSRHILICGTGHAAALAALLALRLARSGYAAHSMDRWDWRTMEALANMRRQDVLIIICFRSMSKPALRLMEHAQQQGLSCLVISDVAGFRPAPDVALCAHRGREGESQSLTVPMAICNALVLELARLDAGKSMKSLRALTALRRELPDVA